MPSYDGSNQKYENENENDMDENSNNIVESRKFSMSYNSVLNYYCAENFNIDTSHHRDGNGFLPSVAGWWITLMLIS